MDGRKIWWKSIYKNNEFQSKILNFVLPNDSLQLGHVWCTSLQSSINQGRQEMQNNPKEHINNKNAANHVYVPGFRVITVSTLYIKKIWTTF